MDLFIAMPGQPSSSKRSNEYYREGSRTLMRIVNLETGIIFALTVALCFYLVSRENQDHFMAETSEGRQMRLASLPYPNMGKVALTEWVANAASQIMTFGFNDLDARFAESRKNFTQEGWESFRKAVMLSGVITDLMSEQQIVTAVPSMPPTLKEEGIIDNVYSWTFEVPLLITFRAGSVVVARLKTVKIILQKVPTSESPNGVGIAEWYMH